MAILHLLRPLATSQLISSSEKRTTSSPAFHRRGRQCVPPASALQSRDNLRLNTQFSPSSFRADGTFSTRANLLRSFDDVDAKMVESGRDPSDVEGSTVSKAGFFASGTITTAPMMSRDPLCVSGKPEQNPSAPSRVMASSEQLNGSRTPRLSQIPPTGRTDSMHSPIYVREAIHGNGRRDVQSNLYEKSRIDEQNQNNSPCFDDMGQFKSNLAPPSSEFYSPNGGDLVLGVVAHSNDLELTVEIGSRALAVVSMREFQPTIEVGTDSFFKLPLDNDSSETVEGFVVPPVGKVLLVGDRAAHSGEDVKIGTIFIAEVLNTALGESRPLLTCRRLSEKLAFLRLDQIMKIGEPVKIEIMHCNDGGLQGSLEGLRAFIPKSELLARRENTAALQDYIGKTLTVAVVKLEHHLSNIVVSEIKPWMSENVLLGSVHDLLVTKLFPYGLQVEILDTRVRGFIHITNISRGFVMSVYAFFTEGDVIRGMVIKGRKPGQLSFSIEALEPPDEDGLVLKERQRVYDGAEEVVKTSPEYQLPLEERRIFARPSSPTGVIVQDKLANLPWLHLEKLKNLS